ncbi:hypothetical protein [Nesterenkonia alkaliphila]|uniref:NIPSNAP family containing protein n=1 Tax=Nesterenkonia alkaliphila TaxID=1463631 RepID=A0A7K1UIQ1_9MICC|nr:hypothetical protein [Nesterenkonia alkaliphila]MVT25921.1 hypothetical protein [Nesterenkonia alkaliphila]GFZ76272.1 hypothetical protein GCM10011359_00020 [Nesterenkonia alkaliphila]
MTDLPQTTAPAAQRTTWMRRYTLDPALADGFVEFLTKQVIPAREGRGFTVESIWLDEDKSQLTWFVSRAGTAEEFAAAEREWEESQERAEIFAGTPKYVTAKDLREVTQLR